MYVLVLLYLVVLIFPIHYLLLCMVRYIEQDVFCRRQTQPSTAFCLLDNLSLIMEIETFILLSINITYTSSSYAEM